MGENRSASRRDWLLSALLFLIYTTICSVTMDEYGLTWDEPEMLVVGERYLAAIATGDFELLEFDAHNPEWDQPDGLHLRILDRGVHPPLPSMAAAMTGRIFGRWLSLMDPVESRHMAIAILSGLTIAAVFLFGREMFGLQAALFGATLLALHPRFFAHAHFNLKDIPKVFFFVTTCGCSGEGCILDRVRVCCFLASPWAWVLPRDPISSSQLQFPGAGC
jgi:hypothetical protein